MDSQSLQTIKRHEREIHDASNIEYIETFVESVVWGAFRRVYVSRLIGSLSKADRPRVLDVGCGPKPSHAAGFGDYVGIDISPETVRCAKSHFPGHDFVIADAEMLPFKSHSFNVLLCFGSLHHLPQPRTFLLEAARCLGIRGEFLGYEPNSKTGRLSPFAQLAGTSLGRLISGLLYTRKKEESGQGPIHSAYETEFSHGFAHHPVRLDR